MEKTKKIKYLIALLILVALIGYSYYVSGKSRNNKTEISQSQCRVDEIKFYYQNACSWCEKVESDGTIEKIEELGIKVKKINAAVGPIRDKIEGTPSFVIDGIVYAGYKTFSDLKKLLGCPLDNENAQSQDGQQNQNFQNNQNQNFSEENQNDFRGERGAELTLENKKVQLSADGLNDGVAKFYNVKMPTGKIIYFFAVKDQFGIYRAAANACEVCYGQRKGFRREGNKIICNNCGNAYPLEKIATEKGGCNPGPINPNLKVINDKINITQAELEQVSDLF